MTHRNRAIGQAALARAAIRALERITAENLDYLDGAIADMPELAPVRDKLLAARDATFVAHRKFEAVALALAVAFNEPDVTAYSGGSADDKEPPPGQGGNP